MSPARFADAIGGDACVIGGPFGSKLTQKDYRDDGVPVIRGTNMQGGRTISGDFVYVSEDKWSRDFKTNTARPGDIIITQRGTLGQVSTIPPEFKYDNLVVSQSQMAVRVNPELSDPAFVYYYLTSSVFHNYIESVTIQTGVPHINMGILRNAPVAWPDRKVQAEIAKVLSALDDKIELNQRMNETLEAQARALFRDWFVDFGPVKAKTAGEPPYLTPDLWSLFPNHLDAGGMPEGWKAGVLSDLFVLQRGFDLPKTKRTDGPYPVIAASGPSGTHNESRVEGPGVCTGRSGVLGGVYYVQSDFWPLNTSLWVKAYPNSTPLHAKFALQEIDIAAFNAGSAVPTLNRNHIHQVPAAIPPMKVVEAFTDLASVCYAKISANELENETIAHTRDLLLPKLMSREIRLSGSDEKRGHAG